MASGKFAADPWIGAPQSVFPGAGASAIETLSCDAPTTVAVAAMTLTRSGWRRVTAERRARARLASAVACDDVRSVDRVDVQRALAGLPRRQRQIAVLRYFLQMDTREVANALGVSEGTVKNSLSKARAALAVNLQIDEQEENDVEA